MAVPDAGGAAVTLAAPVQTPVARDLAAFRRAVRDRRGEGNEYVLLLGLTLLVGAWLIWDILNNPLPY